jgi:hypothetical protein
MTLQLLHSEFPYTWGNFFFFLIIAVLSILLLSGSTTFLGSTVYTFHCRLSTPSPHFSLFFYPFFLHAFISCVSLLGWKRKASVLRPIAWAARPHASVEKDKSGGGGGFTRTGGYRYYYSATHTHWGLATDQYLFAVYST